MRVRGYCLVVVFLLEVSFCFGQKEVDTLREKTLEELFDLYDETDDIDRAIELMKAYVNIAKRDKRKMEIEEGYYLLSVLHTNNISLTYSDSLLFLDSKNKTKAYSAKAYYYRRIGDFKNAIDYYIKVNNSAIKNNDKKLLFSSNYNIGTLKRKIGEYKQALDLYRKNLSSMDKDSRFFLINLKAISNVQGELNNLDSSSYYNKLGIKESLRLNDVENYHGFACNEGIVHYQRGNYDIAIDSIEKNMIFFEKENNNRSLLYDYYYLAKSYQKKIGERNSILYFSKVDSIFQLQKDVSSKIRESYEVLIAYYKKKNDFKKQLFYVNRLLSFDSIVNADEIVLSKKIFKEYDIPKLKEEKELILRRKQREVLIFKSIIVSITLLLLITIVFLIYQYKKKKLYRQRVEEILEERINQEISIPKIEDKRKINVPTEVIESILKKLIEFERRKEFLSNKITLVSLAKDLDTNTNYLSKIINHYKNTTLSNYINSLRIEYTIELLKKNKTVRKFMIKAIAEEVGYNNAESFSKAFYKFKGIKPSFFIQEVNKTEI